MPHLIITAPALARIEACRRFLADNSPQASRRAMQAVRSQFEALKTRPHIGRPLPETDDLRELVIPFGDAGYLALYRFVPAKDAVYILAFRHQRELAY